mgnify:FL=1|tara:strand:+ start:985 stop:1371 length:387 start_codon:yes stop_codon:yes gene_type:complete
MEFFIRKDSLEPILKMELVRDGRNEFDTLHDKLENSTIRFSMKSVDDGTYRILNQPAGLVQKILVSPNAPTEYYIYYRWRKKDVKKVGRYQAMFSIFFHDECTELKVPIREDLFVNITDSFVSSSCVC